ncbi:MAG: 50S ribosomal protein L35 [Cyanobacteriota bacterium]|nr:50S ribosomal protein L35 [Cyanobacteriota bacterium]
MPKLKTRKAAAKRFQVTGSGKIKHRKTGHNHLLEHKTTKRKRKIAGMGLVHERDVDAIHLQMPYSF